MLHEEKIAFLKDHYFKEFVETRKSVERALSDSQTMFCCCGKLATGLHESTCKKFNHKVDVLTIKELSYLLKDK